MTLRWVLGTLAVVGAGTLNAQTFERGAAFVKTETPGQGRCWVEVVVDASAEIEIRGATAVLRNTGGQTPQWRRFECTSPLPSNPQNFRFAGTNGRGAQSLIRQPGPNAPAVVRIEDRDRGADTYSYELAWDAVGMQSNEDYRDRRNRRRVSPNAAIPPPLSESEAIRQCQEGVRAQAADRFRNQNITFPRTSLDESRDGRDRVVGELAVGRRFGRQSTFRFSCLVDYDRAQVMNARIDQFEREYYDRQRSE